MLLRWFVLIVIAWAGPLQAGDFPKDFMGEWKGTLELPQQQKVAMGLTVAPTAEGQYRFEITYGEGEKAQVRAYILKPVKDRPDEWIIDERNGIELPCRYQHGTLYCPFLAGEMLNDTRYRRDGDALRFELTAIDLRQAKPTGPEQHRIKTLSPIVQSARLLKATKGP
jgi:hypothetical protein